MPSTPLEQRGLANNNWSWSEPTAQAIKVARLKASTQPLASLPQRVLDTESKKCLAVEEYLECIRAQLSKNSCHQGKDQRDLFEHSTCAIKDAENFRAFYMCHQGCRGLSSTLCVSSTMQRTFEHSTCVIKDAEDFRALNMCHQG